MMTRVLSGWPRRSLVVFAPILAILGHSLVLAAAEWTFVCDSSHCDTYFRQDEDGWVLRITCADGDYGGWSGSGVYAGTITCQPDA
ncbi:MAG: hypothetical protein OXU68_00625 [Bacteroidota bacterium]|nr:hypothetical protein [Bacteroidota bacterium]